MGSSRLTIIFISKGVIYYFAIATEDGLSDKIQDSQLNWNFRKTQIF